MSKKSILLACVSFFALTAASYGDSANVKVKVIDKSFQPAGGFLAYTEFELSGEPMAESLGLDLDILDPNQLNQPSAFDYTAGIESYEYSEEAMYAVNYQSKMGPHIVNGPVNHARGGNMESLGKRVIELSNSVGFPADEIPLNIYPLSFPYISGTPEYAAAPDVTIVGTDEVELLDNNGNSRIVKVDIPAYFRDYKSLAWREDKMDKSFNPAAIGGQMLKDVMWAQDFLGGMHVISDDSEVEAESAIMDHDGIHALGVSSVDGFNGMMLTEITHDKLLMLRDKFGYNGKNLGIKLTPNYDPKNGAIWFPHKVAVSEKLVNDAKSMAGLKVTDTKSTLRDTWMLLWPLSEFYAYSDQRKANENQNPAFLAVFDGAPFANSPAENIDAAVNNDTLADDPFSLASVLANATFKNIDALHFNEKIGSFMDIYDGKQGDIVTTYDAAYLLQSLAIYQRSQDALPVGYASADASDSLNSKRGKRALFLIKSQADFILENMIDVNGLALASYKINAGKDRKNANGANDLGTQFAVVRGLTAAFNATHDAKYRNAARNLYLAIEKHMFDKKIGTFAGIPGKPTTHTPYTAAAISAGLRELMLTLRNDEGESNPLLELSHLTVRYTDWFEIVINGRNITEGMQLAEWLGDSGENISPNDKSGDTDNDNVGQITVAGGKYGTAMTIANEVIVELDN